jgi:hypothetical protein
VLKTGLSYRFSEHLLTTFDLVKDMDHPLAVRAGIEFRPAESVYLRGGMGNQPIQFSVGAGFEWKSLIIDLASQYHQGLGFVPQISLLYRHPRKSDQKPVEKTE